MKNRRLIIAVGTLVLVLLAYNVLIARAARTSQRQLMLNRLSAIPPQTDCIFLGNSLVEAGCDVDAVEASWPKGAPTLRPANLALGATSPVEHCLILDQALRHPLQLKYVVYGFFDDQLQAPTGGHWSELVGNRALSYYFPNQAAALYSPGNSLKKWQLALTHHLPMLAERSSLWSKVELLRATMSDLGMPKHRYNRFGRVDDFAALEPADAVAFERRCNQRVIDHQDFSLPIQQIVRLAQTHHIKVILIEMPMPSRHRRLFYSTPAWEQYRNQLQQLAANQDLAYIPASDWIEDDSDFEDATHLSPAGAKAFSARLAKALASFGEPGVTRPVLSSTASR
jgi:hypothetical protein